MPVGELAGLAAAVTFSVTHSMDKVLSRRFPPITMAFLESLGGALFAASLALIMGKAQEIADAPLDALLLSIGGGVLSVGVGVPLYLIFVRSVDISKASPLSGGLYALLALFSGVVFLGEDLSPVTYVGVFSIVAGVYMLSLAQRKQSGSAQEKWLGPKGLIFLILVVSSWVIGTSLQRVALRELDVFIANWVRLTAVFIVLGMLALLGSRTQLGRVLSGAPPATEEASSRTPANDSLAARPIISRGKLGLRAEMQMARLETTGSATLTGSHHRNPRNPRLATAGTQVSVGNMPLVSYLILVLNGLFLFGVGSLLMLIALKNTGLAVTAPLLTTELLWITLISFLALRERITLKTIAGIMMTSAGVVLVVL